MAEHNSDGSHKELKKNVATIGCFLDQDIEAAKNLLLKMNECGGGFALYESTESAIDELKESECVAERWLGKIASIGWSTVLAALGNAVTQPDLPQEDDQ